MSQKVDLTKYFSDNKNKNDKSEEFFDQITNLNESSSSPFQESKSEKDKNKEVANEDEPSICKIFQTDDTKKTDDYGNFFDVLSETSGGNHSLHNASNKTSIFSSDDILDSFKNYEENFSNVVCVSEAEISKDAWIPPEQTRKVLIEMVTSPPGSYTPKREFLTMPGVILEEDMKDPIFEAVQHYLGPAEAAKRKVLSVTEVTQDDRGLRDLIQAGCYRAAVNLTKRLLSIYGQGPGKAGYPSKHTVHSIQLWFTRLTLLVKLHSFSLALVESEPFGDLDKPDMFFQFYPELYGGRSGSLVPFSLRLLVSQLPAYVEKHQLALTKLFSLLSTIKKMISNLEKGLLEDGTPCELNSNKKKEAINFWSTRECKVLHSIINVALPYKDYNLAIEIMNDLISRESNPNQLRSLQSALGRIFLQVGDLLSAEQYFNKACEGLASQGVRDLIDSGILLLAQSHFQEAYHTFEKAYELEPRSITALNNMSVCLLYLGRIKDSVLLLEEALQKYPKMALQESLLLNLCTLYELQSSFCSQPKLKLLSLVNQYKGDGLNISCLKLQK